MALIWHGKCESDTAALCKSNGKDTFQTISSTSWQGDGMGAAWERHAMCESALMGQIFLNSPYFYYEIFYRAKSHQNDIIAL